MRRATSRHHVGSEQGMALPLTLAVMLVLTISVTAVVQFSSAAARTASFDASRQGATSIAEDGFNRAISVIAANPTSAGPVTGSAADYPRGGSVTWTGTRSGNVWTVSATASVPNPTGADAGAISKTVRAEFDLTADVGAWNFVYVRPVPGTCLLFQNNFTMESPLYVDGNFCLKNNATYAGPRLHVKGTIQTDNFASVGTPEALVPAVSVKDKSPIASGCRYTTSTLFQLPCGAVHRVYASSFDTTVPEVTKPAVQLAERYAEAAPGDATRGHSCASSDLSRLSSKVTSTKLDDNATRDSSLGAVDLLPTVSYSCTVRKADGSVLGSVQWTYGDPGTLTVSGVVYFDGDIMPSSNRKAIVVGEGVIYANNKIVLQNNTWICGVTDCATSWDPNSEPKHVLFLVAGYSGTPAIEVKTEARFQGGLYAVGGMKVSNGAMVHGPAIANELEAENFADFNPWPWFVDLPDGAPSDGAALTILKLRQGSWRG